MWCPTKERRKHVEVKGIMILKERTITPERRVRVCVRLGGGCCSEWCFQWVLWNKLNEVVGHVIVLPNLAGGSRDWSQGGENDSYCLKLMNSWRKEKKNNIPCLYLDNILQPQGKLVFSFYGLFDLPFNPPQIAPECSLQSQGPDKGSFHRQFYRVFVFTTILFFLSFPPEPCFCFLPSRATSHPTRQHWMQAFSYQEQSKCMPYTANQI